ncbi:MAG: hypothetical protein JWM21_1840 [Acidobacteria bacterium]|nr:hypothetical protein [Acidobacteriota bacterium]
MNKMKIPLKLLISLLATLLFSCFPSDFATWSSAACVSAQTKKVSPSGNREREIATRFAPVFYQALGDNKRADYITKFDFDDDWRGDNNWAHCDDRRFQTKAYVYYSAVETATHYFIHYAVFHARDYKGGERKGTIISELIREGAKRAGKYDPTGIAEESALAHENDMEGCLVVAVKNGNDPGRGRVIFVETLRHNTLSKYAAGETSEKDSRTFRTAEERPLLYVEPKGHGIEAFTGDKQTANKELIIYKVASQAGDPEKVATESVGYELAPLETTLWARARDGVNATYGETHDYGEITIKLQSGDKVSELKTQLRQIGIAFVGKVGGLNMARPPWGWFDRSNREETLGLWFFDPAATIKRDFRLEERFSTAYLHTPFWAAKNSSHH